MIDRATTTILSRRAFLLASAATAAALRLQGIANAEPRSAPGMMPLAQAKVVVTENEENPGYYFASVHLRPHFQLEGMDIGMSLVSKIRLEK